MTIDISCKIISHLEKGGKSCHEKWHRKFESIAYNLQDRKIIYEKTKEKLDVHAPPVEFTSMCIHLIMPYKNEMLLTFCSLK
jgi:hypothetical protein